jgi:hypothetical protein
MDLEIGSNLYRNTDGTVEIDGVPQVTITLKKPDGPMLINFVMFDEAGRLITKVVDSTMAFNERRAHELDKTPRRLLLKHADSGAVVLDVELKEADRVAIKQGRFLTMRGRLFEISPTEWRVDKTKMSDAENDLNGGAVVLG